MNKLPSGTRARSLALLCWGTFMRSVSRVAGVSINTVTKLLEGAGRACAGHHDAAVRGVRAKRARRDEIRSSCYARAENVADVKAAPDDVGNVWMWTALDADGKLVVSYLIGERGAGYADECMRGAAGRLWDMADMVTLVDAREAPVPKRGSCGPHATKAEISS